jgi:exonuclease III
MKIASFNINDINRRLTNLLNWLPESSCISAQMYPDLGGGLS